MPIVWLGVGLVVVAAFVAVLWMRLGLPHPIMGGAVAPHAAPAKRS